MKLSQDLNSAKDYQVTMHRRNYDRQKSLFDKKVIAAAELQRL
jgi:hypothetical protein